MKITKANKRWLEKNWRKVKILEEEGLSKDEIGLIAGYIGSLSNDRRLTCECCGRIMSVKDQKNLIKYSLRPICEDKKNTFCLFKN